MELRTWTYESDLPLRGCYAKSPVRSQWCLGPTGLLASEENWSETIILLNMTIVNAKKRKTVVTLSNIEK